MLKARKDGAPLQAPHVPESGTFEVARPSTAASERQVSLLVWPDERLLQRSRSVHPCAPATIAVADALVLAMRAAGRSSLSAPQIGELARIVCVDVGTAVVLVNPSVVQRRGAMVLVESCDSVPEVRALIERASDVLVEGFEPGTGRKILWTVRGPEAGWIQHEIDHLDGVLMGVRVRAT